MDYGFHAPTMAFPWSGTLMLEPTESEPLSQDATAVHLRTRHWYGGNSRDNFIHRSWMKRGLPDDAFTGRPMIGICNSASELSPCNQHLDDLGEHVKRGVWEAGGAHTN